MSAPEKVVAEFADRLSTYVAELQRKFEAHVEEYERSKKKFRLKSSPRQAYKDPSR